MTHLIADARYTPDGSRITCDCGVRLTGATPEHADEAFAAHRRELGYTRNERAGARSGEAYVFRIKRAPVTA